MIFSCFHVQVNLCVVCRCILFLSTIYLCFRMHVIFSFFVCMLIFFVCTVFVCMFLFVSSACIFSFRMYSVFFIRVNLFRIYVDCLFACMMIFLFHLHVDFLVFVCMLLLFFPVCRLCFNFVFVSDLCFRIKVIFFRL